jgi:Tn3 transposase DDE domain
MPPAEWPRWRPEVIRQTGPPSDGLTRLAARDAALASAMADVERLLARKESPLRVEDDRLALSPLAAAPRPASAQAFAARITERLPRVELSDLLLEVDPWPRFARPFVHAAAAAARRPALLPHFYASVLAHACNFGVDQMAHLTDIGVDHWAWCTTWFLREETLKAACTSLVPYHHRLPLSQAWGSGVLSSSDGQRCPVSGKPRHARRMPPALGYGLRIPF